MPLVRAPFLCSLGVHLTSTYVRVPRSMSYELAFLACVCVRANSCVCAVVCVFSFARGVRGEPSRRPAPTDDETWTLCRLCRPHTHKAHPHALSLTVTHCHSLSKLARCLSHPLTHSLTRPLRSSRLACCCSLSLSLTHATQHHHNPQRIHAAFFSFLPYSSLSHKHSHRPIIHGRRSMVDGGYPCLTPAAIVLVGSVSDATVSINHY